MREISLNIIEFIHHPEILNDQSLSVAQETCLKVLFGRPLNERELEVYRRASGRDDYVPCEQREMTLMTGRRGGKSSRIAAPTMCFEAFRNHDLPRGEKGYILLIATSKRQAKVCFDYIRRYIENSPTLRKRVVNFRKNEIELKNGITIACYPCSYIAVRGVTIVAAVCDEIAFWRHDETAANPEQEILDALRPGMATVAKAKLLKISTPFRKEGILWSEYQRRAELDFPVMQVSTPDMNPAISPTVFEREQQRDEQKFRREFMAEFSENITSWIDPEDLEPCVIRHRAELPQLPHALYVAAIDPAFVQNDFALSIAHRSSDGTIVLDRVARWCGTKKAPLGFEWVCR